MTRQETPQPTDAWKDEFTRDVLSEALGKENASSAEKTAGAEAQHRNSERLSSSAETFAAETALVLSKRMGERWGINNPELLYRVARDFYATHEQTFNFEYVVMAYTFVARQNLPVFRVGQEMMDDAYRSVDKIWREAKGEPNKQQEVFRKHMRNHCIRMPQKEWDGRFRKWFTSWDVPLNDQELGDTVYRLYARDENLPPTPETAIDDRTSMQIATAIETLARIDLPKEHTESTEPTLADLEKIDIVNELSSAVVESTRDGTIEEIRLLSVLLRKATRGEALTNEEKNAVNDLWMGGKYRAKDKLFLALLFT